MNRFKDIYLKITKYLTYVIPIIIILISVWVISILIIGNKSYYSYEFSKNNTLERLTWQTKDGEIIEYTDNDLLEIRDAIIEYLFNKRESMQIVIEGNDFFSYQALEHMRCVRNLLNRWMIITIILIIVFGIWLIGFCMNYKDILPNLFKPTYITYVVVMGVLLVIGVMMLIDFDWTFTWFHHVLFPKPSEFNDAFFRNTSNYDVDNANPYINNLNLVNVLSIEVFMDGAWIIVGYLVLIIALWFIFTFHFRKRKEVTN